MAVCYTTPLLGLYLTKTRAYNPKTGRFLQRDILDEDAKDGYDGFPFGKDAIGTNLYAWCGNNPVNMVDPSGMFGEGISAATLRLAQTAQNLVTTAVSYHEGSYGLPPSRSGGNAFAGYTAGSRARAQQAAAKPAPTKEIRYIASLPQNGESVARFSSSSQKSGYWFNGFSVGPLVAGSVYDNKNGLGYGTISIEKGALPFNYEQGTSTSSFSPGTSAYISGNLFIGYECSVKSPYSMSNLTQMLIPIPWSGLIYGLTDLEASCDQIYSVPDVSVGIRWDYPLADQ